MWDSVELMEKYTELGGKPMRRSALLKLVSEKLENLVVFSAPGYRSIALFASYPAASFKLTKDEEEDNIDRAIEVLAREIKKECSNLNYARHAYKVQISKDIAGEDVANTIETLLTKLSLPAHSLPSLLIGNMITSAVNKHPTPLQIALGVLFHRKKLITHMHDYLVCCSYDEVLRFKHSSAYAQYHQIQDGLEPHIDMDGLV